MENKKVIANKTLFMNGTTVRTFTAGKEYPVIKSLYNFGVVVIDEQRRRHTLGRTYLNENFTVE